MPNCYKNRFRTEKVITSKEIFDGRLEMSGIRIKKEKRKTFCSDICLTNGINCLWLRGNDHEYLESMTSYKESNPQNILDVITAVFDTKVLSWYEPQYSEFDNFEEWQRAASMHEENLRKKAETPHYEKIIKFVTGKLHSFESGPDDIVRAHVAKGLIAENPDLVTPDKRDDLMKSINDICGAPARF